MWSFRGANEKNKLLLINYKKSLQYSDVNENTIKAYQKDVYGLMLWLQDKDIDILVNNAGFGVFGEFTQTDLQKELNLIKTNIIYTLINSYL